MSLNEYLASFYTVKSGALSTSPLISKRCVHPSPSTTQQRGVSSNSGVDPTG